MLLKSAVNIQMTTVKLKIDETPTEEHGTKSLYKSERVWILLAVFYFSLVLSGLTIMSTICSNHMSKHFY